jgi:hypothetical protein
MESNVRKQLTDALLKDLSSKENKKLRKTLQSAQPHMLILDDLNFINNTVSKLIERGRITKDVKVAELDDDSLKKARTIAKKYQDSYIKRHKKIPEGANDIENTLGGQRLRKSFPANWKKVRAGEAFILSSFDQLRKCKQEIVSQFVKTTEKNMKKITSSVDRGHGGGDGVAVSGVQIAKGMGKIDKAFGEDEKAKKQFASEFQTFLKDAFDTGELDPDIQQDLLNIQIKYEQIVTPSGNVSASYVPFVTFQDKYTNRVTDRAREVAVKKLMETFFKKIGAGELASMEGSSSLRDKMIATAIAPLVSVKIKGATVKVDPKIDPRKIKMKTRGKAASSNKSKTTGSLKMNKKKNAAPTKKVTKATQSGFSIAAILGTINAKLPDTVANNMGAPGLEYRTGRFAGSARAVDVIQTPKGFPSIGYTYQKNPYQTFESGFAQGDPFRDPRVVIEKSIREIAAEMAIGRLFTRRL